MRDEFSFCFENPRRKEGKFAKFYLQEIIHAFQLNMFLFIIFPSLHNINSFVDKTRHRQLGRIWQKTCFIECQEKHQMRFRFDSYEYVDTFAFCITTLLKDINRARTSFKLCMIYTIKYRRKEYKINFICRDLYLNDERF